MKGKAKMTRAHFELIAGVITELKGRPTKRMVAEKFAVALKRTNPGFRPEQFVDACFTEAERAVLADEDEERRGAL